MSDKPRLHHRLLLAIVLGSAVFSGLGLSLPAPAAADTWHTQISTGRMLGPDYNPHWFYVRQNGGSWQPTYAGGPLEGRLMNFRAANAIFDDESRSDDDPAANTNRYVSHFDAYREHGILAMTVSLQGGNPGYKNVGIVSAFNPNGTLKAAWMARASQVIEAADARGLVVILSYFYVNQDQVLEDETALKQGIINATDWLISKGYRNVIIEIANEYALVGYDHPIIGTNNTIEAGIGELINLAKSRFEGMGWRLPVTASRNGIVFSGGIAQAADVAVVHGSLYKDWEGTRDTYEAMKRIYDNHDVPVVMSEDSNGDEPNATTLSRDTHAMDDAIRAGGSWGLQWRPYQHFPFRWELGDANLISTEEGYFHAILDVFQQRAGSVPGDTTPPAAPANLSATLNGAGSAIVLNWDDNAEPDLVGYHVYRSPASGGPFTRLTTTPLTVSAYTDSTAPTGTSYYRVTALDTSSNESPPSNTANATRTTPGSTFSLAISLTPNRSNAVPLDGRTVSGGIYVFTTPNVSGISEVRFYLDDPTTAGKPRRIEANPPYDFAGGSVDTANAFNTLRIADGAHTITAAIEYQNGSTEVVSATFVVSNSS